MDPNKMMAQLGAVTVKVSGALEVADITIKPEAIDPDDPEMLQDLLVSAVNGAISAAQQLQQQKMMGQMGGLGLPGM
jgi:DNA-binding YbaB/EbfC family protein